MEKKFKSLTSTNKSNRNRQEDSHMGTTRKSRRHQTLAYEYSELSTTFKDELGQNDTLIYVSEKPSRFEGITT